MRIHPPYLVIGVFAAAAVLAAFVVSHTLDAQKERAATGDERAPRGLERLLPPGPPGAMAPAGVEDGTVAGKVRPETGELPPGYAVFAHRQGGPRPAAGAPAEPPRRVDVAGNGLYRLVLPEGDWRLWAAPGGNPDARAEPVFTKVGRGQTITLDLVAPTASAGLAIAVVEPDGAPSAGAVVTLGRPGDAKLALATKAGSDGKVPVASEMGIAGAAVEVRARNGGRTGAWSGTVPQTGVVTVKLAAAATLEGTVTGTPRPAGFTLTLASQPAPQAWRTLADQRFGGDAFAVPDVPPEPLRLTVRTDDGRTGHLEVRPSPGETVKVAIPVQR
ncbi:MAG: hypothetical protein U0229_10940 [Anaeromyxobacter sp.]